MSMFGLLVKSVPSARALTPIPPRRLFCLEKWFFFLIFLSRAHNYERDNSLKGVCDYFLLDHSSDHKLISKYAGIFNEAHNILFFFMYNILLLDILKVFFLC